MKKVKYIAGFAVVMMVAMSCMGAMPQIGDKVIPEEWIMTNLSENAPVDFDVNSEAAIVKFDRLGAYDVPTPVSAGLCADMSVMDGVVIGDYRNVEGISFRMIRTGSMGADAMIQIKGTTGAIWTHIVSDQLSDIPGESSVINVEINPSKWTYGGRPADWDQDPRWAMWWNRDIANVTDLKVIIVHRGISAETCAVTDFRVLGDGFIGDPVVLQSVNEHFDMDVSNSDELEQGMAAEDSNRDGKSDLAHLIDGEDPGLYLDIVGVDSEGRLRVSWPCVKGKAYRLERCQDLTSNDGFDNVPIDNPVAAQRGVMERTLPQEEQPGPFIYRAVKVSD